MDGMASPGQEAVDLRIPTRPMEDTARLGKEIYQRHIRPQVEPDYVGEVVSIDVDTGSWAIGHEVWEAVDRLRELSPDAVNVWSERVGYKALFRMGGRHLQRTE